MYFLFEGFEKKKLVIVLVDNVIVENEEYFFD